jgi:hypothetical protein
MSKIYENFTKCFFIVALVALSITVGISMNQIDTQMQVIAEAQDQIVAYRDSMNTARGQMNQLAINGAALAIQTQSDEVKQAFTQAGFPIAYVEQEISKQQQKQQQNDVP